MSEDFQSILFVGDGVELYSVRAGLAEPPFFGDLNLDHVVAVLVRGREEYNLAPFFYKPLRSAGEVAYRHGVLRDLEQRDVREAIDAFAVEMQKTRRALAFAEKLRHPHQKRRWKLDAIGSYCRAAESLSRRLDELTLRSDALGAFRVFLRAYIASAPFRQLAIDTAGLLRTLGAIQYAVQIQGNRVRVSRYEGEPDYSVEVTDTFRRFEQGATESYLREYHPTADMNHVEERILDRVVYLFPEPFAELENYAARNRDFLDPTIERFDVEVQFYLAYLDLIHRLKNLRVRFAYPEVSTDDKQTMVGEGFDLALALKLLDEGGEIVTNGFELDAPERVIVVTGPNQGGKTTFARMFGQLHYLASLGVPVPAARARLFLADAIFTHFEREEDITTLRGKLEDELVRIHEILCRSTSSSVIVMNESFSSTSLQDAILLGTAVLDLVIELGALGVCVTFVDELSRLGDAVVSMVSAVAPDDPTDRTFKIERRPADGLAYAEALAKKYGLAYLTVKERVLR